MRAAFLFFPFLLFPYSAVASPTLTSKNCETSLELNPELQGRFSRSFHQGETSTCWGFSGSDLLSYAAGRSLSPLHVMTAGRRVNRRDQNEGKGGLQLGRQAIQEAIDRVSGKKICLADGLNSEFDNPQTMANVSTIDQFLQLSYKKPELRIEDCKPTVEAFKRLFRTMSDVSDIVGRMNPDAPGFERFDKTAAAICERDGKIAQVPKVRRHSMSVCRGESASAAASRETAVSEIDRQMSSHNLVSAYIHRPMSNHYVTILGRKWDPSVRRCMYVVRDSYGNSPSCNGEGDARVCSPSYGPPGSWSVSRDGLAKMLMGVTYLERPGSSQPSEEFLNADPPNCNVD
jgi:hypothetical protein